MRNAAKTTGRFALGARDRRERGRKRTSMKCAPIQPDPTLLTCGASASAAPRFFHFSQFVSRRSAGCFLFLHGASAAAEARAELLRCIYHIITIGIL